MSTYNSQRLNGALNKFGTDSWSATDPGLRQSQETACNTNSLLSRSSKITPAKRTRESLKCSMSDRW